MAAAMYFTVTPQNTIFLLNQSEESAVQSSGHVIVPCSCSSFVNGHWMDKYSTG